MPRLNHACVKLESSGHAPEWMMSAGPAQHVLRCAPDGLAELRENGRIIQTWDNPLTALAWLEADVRGQQNSSARWIGYFSYDLGRWFEQIPSIARDDLNLPLFVFSFHAGNSRPPPRTTGVPPVSAAPKIQSTFTKQQYESAVARVIDYIRAGDIFQVNLSQRFTAASADAPWKIYDRLPPARYGAYLEYENFALLCNSPELFFQVTPDRRIINRPIKGTRPRLPGKDQELLDSPKDLAELNMIIDLQRNDLGRVCEIGSVKVIEPRVLETHPTVFHTSATIQGQLRREISLVDLLRAIFPCGSITGAPKIRAMQIIEELEPVRRGPYCGAIGSLSPDGSMIFNVAIRTMIVKDGLVHIPVGGGVVADSDPGEEYEETLVKAKAMFSALG